MRQLLPEPADPVDPYDIYRPLDSRGRLVRGNMVVSTDGAVTDPSGRSGGLASDGDREVFRTLRALCDVILVGAGTARKEGYGPHRLLERLAQRRSADGRAQPAPIALVSRSLDLDFTSPLFTEAAVPTVVVTCAAAPAPARREAARAGRLLSAGDAEVDLAAAIAQLQADGLTHVLCEGGPSLLAGLVGAQLLDELCLTVAPLLVGGQGPRTVTRLDAPAHLKLRGACEQDGELYLRYGLDPT